MDPKPKSELLTLTKLNITKPVLLCDGKIIKLIKPVLICDGVCYECTYKTCA